MVKLKILECREKGEWLLLPVGRVGWDIGEKFLPVRVGGPGTGCPEMLWLLHPWKCSLEVPVQLRAVS